MNERDEMKNTSKSTEGPPGGGTSVAKGNVDLLEVIHGFSHSTPRTIAVNDVQKVIRFRPSQERAFEFLRSKTLGILNAPTGWGKSLLLVGLAAADLLADPLRKVIVVVPQCLIAKGFVTAVNLELPDGQVVEWQVGNNLCVRAEGKVDTLRSFILSPAGQQLADRVIVTTNMSFAYAFKALEPEAFRNTILVFDEAHHVQASDQSFNLLGGAVNLLLNLNDPSIRMILSTAYFFRGDHLPIIPENHLGKFTRHHIPFDEHWAQLQHIESYQYDFVAFKGTVQKELELLLKASQEPSIIFCPPEGHRLLLGKKKRPFIRRVIRLIKRHYPDTTVWRPGCHWKEKRVILNLASPNNRAKKVRFAMRHGDRIAAIVTVGLFKEGADWVEASRVLDLVPSGSDQDRNQRFGRLIRDCPGKKQVTYYSFFPHVTDEGKGTQREQLTKLYAHFHASLVLENALSPVRIPVRKAKDADDPKGKRHGTNFLGAFDHEQQEAIMRDCCEELVALAADKEAVGKAVMPEEARQTIRTVLAERHGITSNQDELAKQIILILRRRQNAHLPSEELVKAGFDKVWSMDALEGLVLFSGGVGGPSNFREIRRVIDLVFEQQWIEMYDRIRLLPCSPDSQSTSYWWCTHNKVLRKNGKLSDEKVHRLESLPWWSWSDGFESRWMTQYRRISQLPVCPKAGTSDYGWVRQQRRLFDEGTLTPDRIALCETIPWWQWASNQGNWEATYTSVRALPDAPKAGTKEYEWAKHQRKTHAKGKLSSERIELLQVIPWWSWNSSTGDAWQQRWMEIMALPEPPGSTTPAYFWIINQRKRKAAGKLEPDRIARCERIPWWSWENVRGPNETRSASSS